MENVNIAAVDLQTFSVNQRYIMDLRLLGLVHKTSVLREGLLKNIRGYFRIFVSRGVPREKLVQELRGLSLPKETYLIAQQALQQVATSPRAADTTGGDLSLQDSTSPQAGSSGSPYLGSGGAMPMFMGSSGDDSESEVGVRPMARFVDVNHTRKALFPAFNADEGEDSLSQVSSADSKEVRSTAQSPVSQPDAKEYLKEFLDDRAGDQNDSYAAQDGGARSINGLSPIYRVRT